MHFDFLDVGAVQVASPDVIPQGVIGRSIRRYDLFVNVYDLVAITFADDFTFVIGCGAQIDLFDRDAGDIAIALFFVAGEYRRESQ